RDVRAAAAVPVDRQPRATDEIAVADDRVWQRLLKKSSTRTAERRWGSGKRLALRWVSVEARGCGAVPAPCSTRLPPAHPAPPPPGGCPAPPHKRTLRLTVAPPGAQAPFYPPPPPPPVPRPPAPMPTHYLPELAFDGPMAAAHRGVFRRLRLGSGRPVFRLVI